MDKTHGQPETKVCTVRHGTGKRWMVRWKIAGQPARSQSFTRKADAETFRAKTTTEMFTGAYVDRKRSDELFGTFAERWFAEVKVKALRASSRAGERSKLDHIILPRWRDVPLGDIDHAAVQQWVTWMVTNPESRQVRATDPKRAGERKPLSAATAIKAFRVFKQVLAYAVRDHRLPFNPADGVALPKVEHPEETALDHGDVAKLVEASAVWGPGVQAAFLTLAYSAVRFGELAALRVGDVDVAKRTISVRRGIAQVTGEGLVEGTPKTVQSKRDVPILTRQLADALNRQVDGRSPDEYLFPGPDGGPMRNSWLRWRFDKSCEAAGLGPLRIKTLRHTGGSLALDVPGTVVTTVSRMLGHKNVTTTMNVYSHKLANAYGQLADGMDAAVQAALQPDE